MTTALSGRTGEFLIVAAVSSPRPRPGDQDPDGWALVAEYQASLNPRVFDLFVARYQVPVYRYMAGLGGDQFAHDYLNEVFLRAWRGVDSLRPERGSPVSWLFRIARNLRYDVTGSAYMRYETATPAVPERPPVGGYASDPVADAVAARFGESEDPRMPHVLAALARLPQAQKDLLLARLGEGRTTAEVAEELGVTSATAKARLMRALRRVRVLVGLGRDDAPA